MAKLWQAHSLVQKLKEIINFFGSIMCETLSIKGVGHLHLLVISLQKGNEVIIKVIVELHTTGGTCTPKAGYLGVIQMSPVQENQWVTALQSWVTSN